ncbi:hypothetical protein NQ314_011565 [Rhamnusium bicolor]|uniref:SWIM-type domain-containing protein n=1 Tax=Rhamnusium bicolor TaxID=1586634 RepID=A0AAV8XI71_9CUCU|nr:hypothetical protein NQ314_011565 [Rhamnusium bicolor]
MHPKINIFFYTAYVDIALCDCPYGQGGRFCKHLCAVQERFSLVLNTSPLLHSEDRIILAKLALGNEASVDFYMDMDVSTIITNSNSDNSTQNNEQSINIPMNVDEATSVETQQIRFTEGPSDPLHIREATNLKSNFIRISEIALKNPNSDLTKVMHKINLTLGQLTTATQVQSYLCQMQIRNQYSYNRGRQIGVQPTSKSRRKIRPGLTSGAKRIQSGRPSKNESKQLTKKERHLAANINKNTPNAKSH